MKTNTRSAFGPFGHIHPRKPAACSTIEILESRIAPATIIVTNPTDTPVAGKFDLRQALAQADADLALHPGVVNSIMFHLPAPPAHSENIITLGGPLASLGNVTITGPGAGKLIINGAGKYQIFNFNDNNSSVDSPVTVSGLSLIHGAGSNGGAIYSAESLTLKNVTISNNGAGNGGGVSVNGGKHVSIVNSLITGNTAQGFGAGLALYNLTTLTITKSVVTGNVALLGCGGIYGQVTGTGASMAITASVVSGNSASYGGGLYLKDNNSAPASKITVSGTKITGNAATDTVTRGGGGLYIKAGNAVVTGSTIENNTSVYQGGGIEANGFASLTISGSTVSGNRTTGTTGTLYAGGGGVFIEGAGASPLQPVKITGSHITDNQSARNGGGLYALDGVALSISSSTISGNHALGTGGGVSTYGQALNQVNLTVAGTILSGNTAFNGGGIYSGPGNKTGVSGPVSIISSMITGNVSTGGGGGLLFARASSVTIKTCAVTGNAGSYIGGIGLAFVQSFHIGGSIVTGNTAVSYAGGIDSYHSTGTILGTTISGNVAGTKGGGVYQGGSGTVTLQVANVTGNTAPSDPDVYGTFTFV